MNNKIEIHNMISGGFGESIVGSYEGFPFRLDYGYDYIENRQYGHSIKTEYANKKQLIKTLRINGIIKDVDSSDLNKKYFRVCNALVI